MDQKAQLLLQFLEKIGAPLLSGAQGSDLQNEAQAVASMLAKTVEAGIALGKTAQLESQAAQSDPLRMALTAITAPFVSDHYKQNGKIPEEADLQRMKAAFETVMTFSDNFSPSEEQIDRLTTLKAQAVAADSPQMTVQYLDAFMPVMNAIGQYSFGQSETKLMQDVASRLVATSERIGQKFFVSVTDAVELKLINLSILRGVAQIYAAVHIQETVRLSANGDATPVSDNLMAPLWENFDRHVAILEVLAQSVVPGAPSAVQTAQPQAVPPDAVPPAAPPVVAPPLQQSEAAPSSPPLQMPSSPLAKFATKPPSEPPAKTTEAPPVPDIAEQPVPPPESPPPSQDDEESEESGEQGKSGGNPMAFFKKPDT